MSKKYIDSQMTKIGSAGNDSRGVGVGGLDPLIERSKNDVYYIVLFVCPRINVFVV